MPLPGVSLFGFMDQQLALDYLTVACVPASLSPPALLHEWSTAKLNLGPPIPNAGHPNISNIPTAHDPYLQQLRTAPWLAELFQPGSGWELRLVEIVPLLAYQVHVDASNATRHVAGLSQPVQFTYVLSR